VWGLWGCRTPEQVPAPPTPCLPARGVGQEAQSTQPTVAGAARIRVMCPSRRRESRPQKK
jgi:hypothetical protein